MEEAKRFDYLVDTHSHCYLKSMREDKSEWIERLKLAKVSKVLLPNIDLSSVSEMNDLVDEFPNTFYPMMGLHPCDVKENYQEVLNEIYAFIKKDSSRYCGVGEIGLDYHWDLTYQKEQKIALEIQFEWAIEWKKSVSIHSRKSNQDVIPMIANYAKKGLTGVMHCFSGSIQEAHRIIDAGFYLGIGGVLTFPKSGLQEVIKQVDLKYLVLETDSPYLAPVPFRGKRNESSYTQYIAQYLADIKGINLDEVAHHTTLNALSIFNINH